MVQFRTYKRRVLDAVLVFRVCKITANADDVILISASSNKLHTMFDVSRFGDDVGIKFNATKLCLFKSLQRLLKGL